MDASEPAGPGGHTGLTDSSTPAIPGVSGRSGAPENPGGSGAEALVARAGVDGRRLRNALVILGEGRWWTLADLVRETATSRRTVEALLREVDGELERSGDRFRLPAPPAWLETWQDPAGRNPAWQDPAGRNRAGRNPVGQDQTWQDPAWQDQAGQGGTPSAPAGPRAGGPEMTAPAPAGPGRTGPGVTGSTPAGPGGGTGPEVTGPAPARTRARAVAPADPVAHLLPGHAGLVARMDELIAKAPRGRHTLDHVAATGETVVRRALLLDARFWLDGARLLCVGDHDLTSLATALLHPGVEVTVVDVDERILAYIAAQADRLGLPVRTRWADLRLGLPASARAWADLAITDPPYTPEGVGLFVARCAEGLRDREQGRIMLAYGASERTPALALKVQQALAQLNLVNEAIYPDFNRYFGAEAIGSAADLYVLRPTTRTWPAAAARVEASGTAIYTQGPQSVESAPSSTAAPAAGSGDGFVPEVLVGDWPRDVLPKAPRARLATWLAKPYASDPARVAISVPAGLEAALPRLLLATRAGEVRVTLAAPPKDLPADLLAPVYELTAEGTTVRAVRVAPPAGNAANTGSAGGTDAAAGILRRVLDNAHGKLANTWREALIKARGDLTKRQARAVVAAVAPWADDVTVLELPAHRLLELRAAVESSLSSPADAG
ncbi:bis-aminopropyl spermidine synthase family protein [Streptosporangium sp. NPDC048865]|uniref:bis-aminopropyl spermidine synthase family protein n=1 Tax=Streptosporangium sp. NPDC048865 TaxID=3155766 RepID=UPI0034338ABD